MTDAFASRVYALSATTLFAIEAGDGPPVVLLHGITANAYVWEPVATRLARQFRVIAVDQRGHGRSGRPDGATYAAEEFADDIAAVVKAAGGGPALLVGHSLGARNALVAAVRHPDRVAGVIAIDFTPFIEPATFDALDERVAGGDCRFATIDELRAYLRRRYPLLPDDAIERRARHGYAAAPDGDYAPLADGEAMMRTCQGLRTDLAPILAAITAPCLLMRGAASGFVSEPAFLKAAALRPDLPTQVVAAADHYVHEEQPETVARAVEEFAAQAVTSGRNGLARTAESDERERLNG